MFSSTVLVYPRIMYDFPSMLCENVYIAKRIVTVTRKTKGFSILKTVYQRAVQSRIRRTFPDLIVFI